MKEITGIYGTAKVFSDVIDTRAEEQILELMNQPFMENAHVRMMPDVHAGTGCTVGTTLRILKDSVEITKLIKPLYNFKASEDGYHRKDRNG